MSTKASISALIDPPLADLLFENAFPFETKGKAKSENNIGKRGSGKK